MDRHGSCKATAAQLSTVRDVFREPRETQAAEGLRTRRCPPSATAPAARKAPAPAEKSMALSSVAALRSPPAAASRPAATPCNNQRRPAIARESTAAKRELPSEEGNMAMAAAEMAAKRAELELLELVEAEANAKSSRNGRQREA